MGRKPIPLQHKRSMQISLMLSPTEMERVNRLTELGGFITAPDAIRAAVDEMLDKIEREQSGG